MASAWHSKRQRTEMHPAEPAPPTAAAAADDAPWVQRCAAAVWHQTQQQQHQQQRAPSVSGRDWGGNLWGSGGDAGVHDQQEAGSAGQHGWSEDSGWDTEQQDDPQQEQQQQEWDGGVWGQQDDEADADPAQQQQQPQHDIEAEAEEGDDSDNEQQQQQQQEDEDDEPVQLESADFDLSRDEVIARIEQLAFDLIASAAADGQLPTLSCISTARSNVHMAPRHSSITTAAEGLGSQGFGTNRNTQQGLGTQGAAGQLEEQDWEGSDADAAAAAAGAKDGVGSQQQQQHHVLRLGSKVQTRSLLASGGAQANSIVRALQLLDSVHALLRSGRSATQRDLYYNLVGRPGFQATRDVSSAISSVLGMLRVPRAALGISAASKGAVAGCLLLRPRPGEAWFDCRSVGPSGRPIPGEVGAVDTTALRPAGARFILVVEKDAVFQSLVESRLHEQLPCVIITGRGMPDVASRAFLAAVVEASKAWGAAAAGAAAGAAAAVGTSSASLSSPWQQQQQQPLPVLGLVDWNPGGVGILLAYKYGCAALGLESARYAVPSLCWLGVTSHMLQEGRVPQSRCHALSDRDKTLMPGLKARLAGCPAWVQELQEMEGLGLKADIEALQHEELMRQVQQRVLQGSYLR